MTSWACDRCTLENLGATCDACGAVRPKRVRTGHTWDCRRCTCTNEGRALACSACGELHFSLPLPPLCYGVEFEFVLINAAGWDLADLAAVLTNADVHCKFEGYTHRVTRHWKVVPDRSVSGSGPNDLSFELVSPILSSETGFDEIVRALHVVNDWLGVGINQTTGFHVHVDGAELSTEQLRKIVACFCKYESAIDALIADKTRQGVSNTYARSNRAAFGLASSAQRNENIFRTRDLSELIAQANPGRDRYYKLNLTPMESRRESPTIEFRSHGGTVSAATACCWVRLLLHFVHNAAHKPRCTEFPEGKSTRSVELAHLFGEEVHDDTLRHHFVGVGGPAHSLPTNVVPSAVVPQPDVDARPWVCTRCGRSFATSRQLMQHRDAKGHTE